jgi:hypothetical protein
MSFIIFASDFIILCGFISLCIIPLSYIYIKASKICNIILVVSAILKPYGLDANSALKVLPSTNSVTI